MSAVKWHDDMVTAYDCETTGVNPTEARIVTAAIVYMTPGQRPRPVRYTIDPGIPIPDEAAQVHGWTTDRLHQEVGKPDWAIRTSTDSAGRPTRHQIPRDVAIYEITGYLAATIGRGQALVVHNAAYDLTLLEHEAARHQVDPLTSRPAGVAGVVDPMVIEKAYDPWRKVKGGCKGGKTPCAIPGGCGVTDKKLESLCTHYGVRHAGTHDAADDAIATVRLMRRLLQAWPQVAAWKLGTLHDHQVAWRREQADSLRAYFDRAGIEHDGVDPGWPVQSSVLGLAPTAGAA